MAMREKQLIRSDDPTKKYFRWLGQKRERKFDTAGKRKMESS